MPEIPTWRLHLLRALYLLIAVGLALMIWPLFQAPPARVPHMAGVVRSMLTAVSLLALLGVRHPLRMLPLLFFELAWKIIWVLAYGLPLWRDGQLTTATRDSLHDCLPALVLIPLALPWNYIFRHYVRAGGERWRGTGTAEPEHRPEAPGG